MLSKGEKKDENPTYPENVKCFKLNCCTPAL